MASLQDRYRRVGRAARACRRAAPAVLGLVVRVLLALALAQGVAGARAGAFADVVVVGAAAAAAAAAAERSPGAGSPAAPDAASPVVVLTLRDAIGPASARYVERSLAVAHARGAPLVVLVLELDTPGGLDTAMRQIVQAILASPVPVATFVSPQGARAASAGTYVLLASHVAAMAPATTLGAATPVAVGLPGSRQPPERAPQADRDRPVDATAARQVSDAAAFIRGLAERHGRDADRAESAVRESASLTAEAALARGVVDLVAADVPELVERADGRTVRTRSGLLRLETRGRPLLAQPPTRRDRLLSTIAHPSVALVLMMIGLYGLLFEFMSPGFGVGGTVGAISLLLGLFALQMLPFSAGGLALVALGAVLLVAEMLTPAFGVLGLGGVLALAAGALLLFERGVPGFSVPEPVIVGVVAAAAAGAVLAVAVAWRTRGRRATSGREEMIGDRGEIVAVEAGEAWALVHGERWRVRSSSPLAVGQRVRVTALEGLLLDVADARDGPLPPTPSKGLR